MELTPEERQRIYQEEKAKLEQNSPGYKAGWQVQRVPRIVRTYPFPFVLLLFIGLIGLLMWVVGSNNNSSQPGVQPTINSPVSDAIFKPSSTPSPLQASTPSPFEPSTATASPPTMPGQPSVTISGYNPTADSEESVRQHMLAVEKDITYEHLKKNADRYDSYAWSFTGKVFQIQEQGGRTTALVSLDAWGNKLMWVTANFATEFVEKDQVYVVGYLAGSYSYTSVAGWNVTVPAIEARAILKPAKASQIKAGKKASK